MNLTKSAIVFLILFMAPLSAPASTNTQTMVQYYPVPSGSYYDLTVNDKFTVLTQNLPGNGNCPGLPNGQPQSAYLVDTGGVLGVCDSVNAGNAPPYALTGTNLWTYTTANGGYLTPATNGENVVIGAQNAYPAIPPGLNPNLTVWGNHYVSGGTTIGGDLTIVGAINPGNQATTFNGTTIFSTVPNLEAGVNITAGPTTINGTTTIAGTTQINTSGAATTSIGNSSGQSTTTITGALNVNGNASIGAQNGSSTVLYGTTSVQNGTLNVNNGSFNYCDSNGNNCEPLKAVQEAGNCPGGGTNCYYAVYAS